MTAAFEWLLGVVLAAWFIATVVRNLPRIGNRVIGHDPLVLVPFWWLFAQPRMADPVLLRRWVDHDGALSPWTEVPIIVPRPRWSFIWHPSLGPKRALLTEVAGLGRSVRRASRARQLPVGQGSHGANAALTSTSYITLLDVASVDCDPVARAVQFMVVQLPGQQFTIVGGDAAGGEVVVISEFHRLDRVLESRVAG